GEAAPERSVADLAQAPAVALVGALVATLAAHDQGAAVDLDGHVLLRVQTGQLEADQRVVAVAVDLGGRREADPRDLGRERTEPRIELGKRAQPGVTPAQSRHSGSPFII